MSPSAKPHILIVYTGGTIGMIEDPDTGSLQPFDFDHLIDNVPKIKMLKFDIDHVSIEPPIDSSDMNPAHWVDIARAIESRYDDYDGFVVLHGTDTMAYTSSALSFMLEGLCKPVIIPGSQLPIAEGRTDGEGNLITALQIADQQRPDGTPMVQEVAILFENYLWRGNRATKMSADNFNAFKSNNYPPLAKIGLGIHYNMEALWHSPERKPLVVHYNMDPDVFYINLFPGMTECTLRHLLNTPSIKGIVLKSYGAGNGPTVSWFTRAIGEAVASGKVILNVTQCVNGGVHARRYVAGDRLADCGVVSGHDMTSEAAITKMMHLFGRGLTPAQVASGLERDLCGELS